MIDTRLAPYGAFAIRAALGIMFIAHAYLKIAVFTVPGFAGFLTQTGFPATIEGAIRSGETAAAAVGAMDTDYASN